MKRTPFMQSLMSMNYGLVAMEAIERGFDGSLERLVAKSLRNAIKRGDSEAEVIVEAAGGDLMKAAYLITSSKIEDHDKVAG